MFARFLYRSATVGLLAGALALSLGASGCTNRASGSSDTRVLNMSLGSQSASHTTSAFAGVKVNGGTATHSIQDGKSILTLSDDFVIPQTPAPHWQVVDSRGNTYLLQRLGAKSLGGLAKDRINMSITLPAYIKDVAKVQIYCAWAEAVLGETSFGASVMTTDK